MRCICEIAECGVYPCRTSELAKPVAHDESGPDMPTCDGSAMAGSSFLCVIEKSFHCPSGR
jgi:hypothetical protein